MSLLPHRLPRNLLDALAAGGGGPDAIRVLAAAERSKHAILLHGVLTGAQAVGHEQAMHAHRGYELLIAAQRMDPASVEAVIRHPSVGAWALHTVRALRGGAAIPGAVPGALCAVAAAAAIRARLPATIDVPVVSGVVVLPSLGLAIAGDEGAVVRSTPDGAEVTSAARQVELPSDPHQDGPGWRGLRHLRTGPLKVLIDDLDPFRMPAAPHVAPRLRAAEVGRWDATFQRAWWLLEQHHPSIAAEVATAVRVIVPLSVPQRGLVSSSSPEAFSAVALSEPPDPCTLAATLAHEVQHLKLSALLDSIDLTLPDDGRRFYAPWREDPRPVSGLLQGAYAYLGVSRFWRRQRHLGNGHATIRAHAEFARWRWGAAGVVETLLSSGQLTPAGLDFVQGMARTLSTWQGEPVPEDALGLARQEAEQHLARWRSSNARCWPDDR